MSLLNNIYAMDRKQLFRLTVIYPFLVVLAYLYIFMPDRYQSSAVVLVKDSSQMVQAQTGLLASLGVDSSGTSEDMKLLQAFVQSKSLALELDNDLGLREHYGASWDFIFGIGKKDSNEDYFDFYKKHVQVKREIDTSLLEISVEAYTPEKALEIVNVILGKSESFVNQSGKAIAESEMSFAREEIALSQEKLKQAKVALLEFQNQHNLIDPEGEGESLLTIVFELEAELANTEAELGQVKSYLSPNAPKLKVLEARVKALRDEINQQKSRVAGGGAGAELNALAIEYQSLAMDVELASSLYSSALSAFELARVQAGKQLKHLVVAASPQKSGISQSPTRVYWAFTIALLLLLLNFVSMAVQRVVAEHAD